MKGWLVNDCLTCIPGTRTFWHDLLDYLPGLVDQTNGYTPYDTLARRIELLLEKERPDYIIRNGSYFPPIRTLVPQVAIAQDLGNHCSLACNQARYVVANSRFTLESLHDVTSEKIVIPLGVDTEVFSIFECRDFPADIVYVGDSSEHPKSFSTVRHLIESTNFTFNLVMKDQFTMNHERVRCFNRVNSSTVARILNSSRVAICPSFVETQHLAGIEAMACGVPVVAVNTGIYYELTDGQWGIKTERGNFIETINRVLQLRDQFNPRSFVFDYGLDKKTCMNRWNCLIQEVVHA